MNNIVSMKNITIDYKLTKYDIRAVTNVNLDIKRGKITALVGESGSGKSTIASSLIQCITSPGVLSSGEIYFYDDENDESKAIRVDKLNEKEINNFRWEKISMVFQSAQSALNPVMTVFEQFYETFRVHHNRVTKAEVMNKTVKLLEYVKLDVNRVLNAYPHELSGGMKQRVMIAFSLLLDPKMIILDEPTTALDVITQDYIFKILKDINRDMGISMLLMTHDIGVVAKFSDYVGVMYAGRLMEYGTAEEVFEKKLHPYTKGLINATPSLIGDISNMCAIPGTPPNLRDLPKGCVFNPRCNYTCEKCMEIEPQYNEVSDGHMVKCHLFDKEV
jgi:peptide/nickel transport system ATP-binding protein